MKWKGGNVAGKLPRGWQRWQLGERLSWLRGYNGYTLSLSKAAKEMGLTKAHLWELEDGRASNPTLKTLLAICRVYDISIQKLTEGL